MTQLFKLKHSLKLDTGKYPKVCVLVRLGFFYDKGSVLSTLKIRFVFGLSSVNEGFRFQVQFGFFIDGNGKMFPWWSLFTICGDTCPLSCISAEACLTGWPNGRGRRDGQS